MDLFEYLETIVKRDVKEWGNKSDIYKNPTIAEISELIKNQSRRAYKRELNRELRALYHTEKDVFYVFSTYVLHPTAGDALGFSEKDALAFYIDFKRKKFYYYNPFIMNKEEKERMNKKIKNNSWIKNVLSDFKMSSEGW